MRITIIGAGPGGYETAIYAAKCGAEVTLVEKGSLGGTCLNVGCIPTKALLAASDVYNTISKAAEYGAEVPAFSINYAKAVGRKDKVVSMLVKGVEMLMKANNVRLLRGTGSLKNATTVSVALADGGQEDIEADAIILATGSVPSAPRFIPVDGEKIFTSNEVLALTEAPGSILIVGGGVIGCEIGQFLARAGSAVTIIEMLPQILPLEDEDAAKALGRQFRRQKIKTICGNGIAAVETTPTGVKATLADGTVLEADKMLVAVGRRPYTEGLGLENAGLSTDERGFVPVDGKMATNVKGIYAIGDIVPGPQLAHVASKEGIVAVDNILGGDVAMSYKAVPRCVYTDPQVAAVGLTEHELQAAGTTYKKGQFDFIANGKAKAAGTTDGYVKVLVDDNDVIVGTAIVGDHTTEMLPLLTLAVETGLTASQVGNIIYAHPTMSESIREALHDIHGKSVQKP